MPRYLSADWFEAVGSAPLEADPSLVVEQVVHATPDGDVTYRVEIAAERARIVWPVPDDAPAADLRITTDWPTAVAVARGDMSTQAALMRGLLRFRGHPDGLGQLAAGLAAMDPVPAAVRGATTFDGG